MIDAFEFRKLLWCMRSYPDTSISGQAQMLYQECETMPHISTEMALLIEIYSDLATEYLNALSEQQRTSAVG